MNVLAVGAHPDDLEMGCFGTLLKHKAAGHNVEVLILTKGGYSLRDGAKRTWATIQREARDAEEILGTKYQYLDCPILGLQATHSNLLKVEKVIARVERDLVITHWWGDSHQDHQAAFKMVRAAARRGVKRVWCMEIGIYSNKARRGFTPHQFVDITPFMERKIAAVKAYQSYVNDRLCRAIKGLASHRALALEHCRFAEAFEVLYQLESD